MTDPHVGSAANLFGGGATDSDPFASIAGGGASGDDQAHTQGQQQPQHSPTNLFGTNTGADDWLSGGTQASTSQSQHQDWQQQGGYSDQSEWNGTGYDAQPQDPSAAGYDYGQQDYAQYDQGQHGQYGQYDQASQAGQYDQSHQAGQYDQYAQYGQDSSQQYGGYAQDTGQYAPDASQQQYDASQYGHYDQQYAYGQQQQGGQDQYGAYAQQQNGQNQYAAYDQQQSDPSQYGAYDQQHNGQAQYSAYDQQPASDQSQYGAYDQQYDQSQYGAYDGYGQNDQQYEQYDQQPQQQQYTQGQYDGQYDQQYNGGYSGQYDAQAGPQPDQQQQYAAPVAPAAPIATPSSPYDSPAQLSNANTSVNAYDPQTASVYEPSNHSASSTSLAQGPPPRSPAQSTTPLPPPPPKGPPRGPSRNSGVAAQPAPAPAPQPAPTAAPEQSPSSPAPWDLAPSSASTIEVSSSLSSAPSPILHRQPTPRLTVTDESGLEGRPADLDSIASSDNGDDEIDEATRDFNDLQLGIRSSKSKKRRSKGGKSEQAPEETPEPEQDPWFGGEDVHVNGEQHSGTDADEDAAASHLGLTGTGTTVAATTSGNDSGHTTDDDPWFGKDDAVAGSPAAPTAAAVTKTPSPAPSLGPPQRKYTHTHQISSISQADDAWFAEERGGDDAEGDGEGDETIPASTAAFGEFHDDEQVDGGEAVAEKAGEAGKTSDVAKGAEDPASAHDPFATSESGQVAAGTVAASSTYAPEEAQPQPTDTNVQDDSAPDANQYDQPPAANAYEQAPSTNAYNPYAPSTIAGSDVPTDGASQAYNPYAPVEGHGHDASMSKTSAYDAYAPQQSQEATGEYDPYASSSQQGGGAYGAYAPSGQEGAEEAAAYGAYAPSGQEGAEEAAAYNPYASSGQQGAQRGENAGAYNPYAPSGASSGYDAYDPEGAQGQDATAAAHYDGYAPQGVQDRDLPAAASEYDAYAPQSGHGKDSSAASSYEPYAPVGGHAKETSSASSYDPYAPVGGHAHEASSTSSSYDPHGPAGGHAKEVSSSSSYNPYAPQGGHGQDASTSSSYNPYAPVGGHEKEASSSSSYNPYAPVEGHSQNEQVPRAPAAEGEYEATYTPATHAAAGDETITDAYSSSGYGPYGGGGYDAYGAPQTDQQQQSSHNPYAPSETNDAYGGGYGSHDSSGWGSTLSNADADPYGPSGARDDDEMEVLDTPLATHPPRGLASPFAGPKTPSANGLARGKTITQRSYSQPGMQKSRAVSGTVGQEDDYFARPGSAAGGLASPYDPGAFTPSGSDGIYHAQAADPIEERRGAKIPVVTFGLDGKVAAFFPLQTGVAAPDASPYGGYGSDVAQPTKIVVRQLSSLVPPTSSASSFDPLTFPGPAFESTSGSSGAIARATGTTGVPAAVKTKKTALIKYLRDAADEMNAGMGYRKRRASFAGDAGVDVNGALQGDGNADAQKTEDRILLLRLLAIVLEQDGNTVSNAAFDEAVRQLLTSDGSEDTTTTFAPANMPAVSHKAADTTLVTTEVTANALKQIQEFLMSGQRKEAVDFAVQRKLWAHAMVIASAVDQATWRKVAQEFAQHEVLSALQESQETPSVGNIAGLKLMYDVFSGQDPSSIYQLFKPAGDAANGPSADKNWRQSAAMIIANRCAGDSAALTAMGDGLLSKGWQEAAHVCYLLSPQTSTVGGADGPNVRLTLLGAHSPLASTSYVRDLDHLILSEVYEFSHALVPTVKGQEAFPGLAYLQAYRLVHAYRLAELGETKRAQKYCEAIASVMKASKNSPYFHRVLVTQLKELSDRLVGGPQLDSGGNWVTRKMQRPTLDGMLSAFEGRFTKFIAGDDSNVSSPTNSTRGGAAIGGQQPGAAGGVASTPNGPGRGGPGAGNTVGAFSHYSAITPDAGSASVSRVQSFADFSQSGSSSRPASRAASALGRGGGPSSTAATISSPYQMSPYEPYSSTSSSSDWEAGGAGGVAPYAAGAGYAPDASDGGGYYSSSRAGSEADTYGSHVHSYGQTDNAPWPGESEGGEREDEGEPAADSQDSTFVAPPTPQWGYDADSAGPEGGYRPQFFSTSGGGAGGGDANDGEGFLSPMDTFSPAGSSTPYAPTGGAGVHAGSARHEEEDEDDDLGFGNTSKKRAPPSAGGATAPGPSAAEQEAERKRQQEQAEKDKIEKGDGGAKPELKSSPSTSWLGRLWGRRDSSDSTAGGEGKAKQAHMGEQSSFYYDKELKRWVNKKAGDTGGTAATPPPPPRATTASPSMASRSVSGPAGAPHIPPSLNRTATTDANTPPGLRSASASYSYRGTPPIAEDRPLEANSAPVSATSSPPMGSGGPPGITRARSNLGDPNQPPAVQPPMNRPGSALGGAFVGGAGMTPPGSASTPPPPRPGAAGKKKPISKRYVRVD